MDNKSILKKVQKLLSLANSDNEHEAKLAMDRANELLVKHNLTMQQASIDLDYQEEAVDSFKRAHPEFKFACGIVSKFFFVQPLTSVRYVGEGRYRHKEQVLNLIGTETNVHIASYVYSYLTRNFKSLFKAYRKETGCLLRDRRDYYVGLYMGLCDQLKETRQRTEKKTGLVLVKDMGLERYMDRNYIRATSRNHRLSTSGNAHALNRGKEAGKNMRISRGISSTGQRGLYLA
jgi:hypothetical protein